MISFFYVFQINETYALFALSIANIFVFYGGIIFFPVSRFPKPSSILSDLKVVCGDKDQLSALVHLFENHIGKEWFEPWDSFNWVVNNL